MTNRDQPSHPTILALDTSSKRASMAVSRGARLVASLQGDAEEKRSERLWAEIDSLLRESVLTINDIDLFSVCTGPGAFTGLRVGIAAMKGFASANGKKIVGVTSLEAAALCAAPAARVLAALSANRGEVYSQLFGFDAEGVPVAEGASVVTTPDNALARVASLDGLVFAGDWAVENASFIREFGQQTGWSVAEGNRLGAECVAEIGLKKYFATGGENPEQIRACYVRPAEAEIKLSQGVLGSKIKRLVMQD